MKIEKLSNGMNCIFIENSASDVVSIQIWIKCGSVNESKGEYGVSHFIEHLLFKGTRKHDVGEVARVIESLGGDLNAFTAKEYTCFYVTLPSIHFRIALETLKELVFFPKFDAAEIESEREVILEEIRRYQDIPGSIASDNYFELHFKGHPYSKPILGTEDVIRNIKRDNILAYYKKFYTASNAILSICGNVKQQHALTLIPKIFAELPALKAIDSKVEQAALKTEQSAKAHEMDIVEPILEFGFPIPGLLHEDVPALDVLAIILGQGESSRLFKSLRIQTAMVTGISSYSYTPVYGGTFSIGFSFEPSSDPFTKKLEDIFAAIHIELNEIMEGEFTDSEIDKAKNILMSEKVYERETVEGYARKLGHLVCVTGGFDFEDTYFKSLMSVSRSDIMKVASKYLDVSKVTMSSVIPKNIGCDAEHIMSIFNSKMHVPVELKKLTHKQDVSTRPAIEPCCEFKKDFVVEKPKLIKHKSGARIITRQVTSTPLVSFKIILKGGVLLEDSKHHGICNLLSRTMLFGAGEFSFEDIVSATDATASTLQAFSGRNSIGLTLECIKPFLPEMLELMEKIILEAKFEKKYFDNEKKLIQDEIKASQDNVSKYANSLFLKTLYQEHPYSLDPSGTVRSVGKIKRQDVISLYKDVFNPSSMVISAVGDFDHKVVCKWTDGLLNKLSGKMLKIPTLKAADEQTKPRINKLTKETKQAHIFVGYKTCNINSTDMYPLKVLSSVLSGQSGRLFINLRDKQSLAYTVAPIEMFGPEPGYFAVYIATENSKIDRAIKEIKRELDDLKGTLISDEELYRAKNFIMGRHAIALQSYGEQASNMALDELFGLGYNEVFDYSDKIMAVSAEDVIYVANRYFVDIKENIAVVHNG